MTKPTIEEQIAAVEWAITKGLDALRQLGLQNVPGHTGHVDNLRAASATLRAFADPRVVRVPRHFELLPAYQRAKEQVAAWDAERENADG